MSTPSTTIYVRPGSTSHTWSYAGATAPSGAALAAVAFDTVSADGQQVARGEFQYSVDGGRSWAAYVLATDSAGAWVPAAGTLWRFVDHASGDTATPGAFTMHWKLADNSVLASPAAVVVDLQPVGIVGERATVFTTLHAGDAVATLNPIDTGALEGGRWVIDSQSQPGLFSITPGSSADGSGTLRIANPAAMPASGLAASVTVHFYDAYQVDGNGNPIANTGVTETFNYTAVDGASADLPGLGADLTLGASSGALHANPAMATLSDGAFVTVWQGASGGDLWARVTDAAGVARGAAFAIPAQAGVIEGEPAVAALAGGRFVVAYSVIDGGASRIAYRLVEANGASGPQLMAGSSAAGDAAMPAVATLADGSFVIGWRSGGAVHTLQAAAANGAALGAEHVTSALGTAFSPAIAALANGSYVVAWGEIGDGNVYTAIGPNGAPLAASLDGAAASISTAAPLAHVAALAGGGFVVAWDSYSNDMRAFTISDIFVQRYDGAGNKLGDVIQADVDSGTGRYDAAVAALSDGGFVVGWQSQGADFDGNGVYGRRFGADGSAIDQHEFEINQMRQGDQASPALTALAGGGFAAAWVDSQGGASSIETRVLAGAVLAPGPLTTVQGGTADGTPASQGGSSPAPAATAPGGTAAPASVAAAALTGSAGSNVFAPGPGDHTIDGQDGFDTVSYHGLRADFTLARGANGFSVTDKLGVNGHDALVNVERIQFSDLTVALDLDGAAGKAYRLYQAAFDRVPDQGGLGFWIHALDNGITLDQAAAAFATSKEFADLYGAQSSDAQLVDLLYKNVLHRAPEGDGYDFWLDALANKHVAREVVLDYFSESPENQAQVIGSIQDGIAFVPWG